MSTGSISVLSINKKYHIQWTLRIALWNLDSSIFLDLSSPLDKLSSFLNIEKLKLLEKEFENISAEYIFPYDYIDSWNSKLDEAQLPSKECFYN